MKLTNKLNLPDAIYQAVKNDPYSKQGADFSITELIDPPRKRALTLKYYDQLEEDTSDRIWSLIGQAIHVVLERANKTDLVEKRFFGKFGEFTLSGQIDSLSLEDGILSDYKVTTAWGFMANRPAKPEWCAQLNCQLELLRMNGMDADRLQIIGILRDWQIAKSKTDRNYPNFQVAKHEIPVWPREKTQHYINQRIRLHMEARERLPYCDLTDTWGGRRCASYCLVNTVCQQYQQTLNDKEPA